MRRKDREITQLVEISDILRRCPTVRLGLMGAEHPYIVPLSFGFEVDGGIVTLYLHSAGVGRKLDLMEKAPAVCVEADIFHGYAPTEHGVTTTYESVIGFGVARRAEGEEKIRGLQCICAHCGYSEYPVEDCGSLDHTAVVKVTLESVSGKRNLG